MLDLKNFKMGEEVRLVNGQKVILFTNVNKYNNTPTEHKYCILGLVINPTTNIWSYHNIRWSLNGEAYSYKQHKVVPQYNIAGLWADLPTFSSHEEMFTYALKNKLPVFNKDNPKQSYYVFAKLDFAYVLGNKNKIEAMLLPHSSLDEWVLDLPKDHKLIPHHQEESSD